MPAAKTLTPSRRDAHKSRTSRALREAALQLFATQGYDTTTTEEIAEKAGVAARTFFRYFPTKESVLNIGEQASIEAIAADFLAQPAKLSDVDAMCAALVSAAPGFAENRKYLLLYQRAIASSTTLRGRQQDHRREDDATIAQAIATRRGLDRPDESCALLATIAFLTLRRTLDNWLAGPARADLGAAITDEFALLGKLFAGK